MNKYIDLAERIASKYDMKPGAIRVALGLLDHFATEHPDQVPGRTITAAKFNQAVDIAMDSGEFDTDEFARQLGITVTPDPEPTNAEKLAIYLGLHDLDAITQAEVAEFARQLDADGVKAPEGDDE